MTTEVAGQTGIVTFDPNQPSVPLLAKPIVGWDTETDRISQARQHPLLVCLSMAVDPMNGDPMQTNLLTATCNDLKDNIRDLLTDRTCIQVGQVIGFDLAVLMANFPEFMPLIFAALEDGVFSDISIREKLLNLSAHGDLEFSVMPDGSKSRNQYNMAALVKKYIGIDITADKDSPDAWRTNYGVLIDTPKAQWPASAIKYAVDDAIYPVMIWKFQEERRQQLIRDRGVDPFVTEAFRVYVDFCLKLMSGHGAAVDPAKVAEIEAMLAKELAPDKLDLLIQHKILEPATPPRPKKGKAHVEHCGDSKDTPCNCPPAMTKGTDEKVNNGALRSYVEAFARRINDCTCFECNGQGTVPSKAVPNVFNGCKTCGGSGYVPNPNVKDEDRIKLRYTEPTEKFPNGQLSVTSDFLNEVAHMDPVLSQYKHRQDLQKLVTTEIPRMKLNGQVAPVVYPQYDCLKETGRTSSFSSKSEDYASFNCQNVDPRVRECFVPRPGYLLFSVDYSQMELGTLAQTCYNLFGYSVLRDKINAGVDVHAYTGSQLAFAMAEDFQKMCITVYGNPSPQQVSECFLAHKEEGEGTTEFKFYKHWRKFAKPVNLGYPGGLGPKTFVKYAGGEAYNVKVTEEEAATLRELWKKTYPEMVEYFQYINKQCIDPHNKGWDEDTKEEYAKYCYRSPYGLYRAGCDYCACANGLGLQTPSADGVLTATINLMKACIAGMGPAILAPVDGVRVVAPIMLIHDEFIGEVKDDEFAHDRMMAIRQIMIDAMRIVTPDVVVNANAVLMRRWDKRAEPTYKDGRLTVWTPAE